MSDFTVICCYNDEKEFCKLVKNLEKQKTPHEIIGINNSGNKKFSSCSAAYNSVKNKISTKFVIYSHQDISFLESDALSKFLSTLEKINVNDILGVAGVKFDSDIVYSNIEQIYNPTGEIILAGQGLIKNEMIECDTIDECFFGGYTEHFKKFPFDEKICDNWHLYAVEQCLRTKINCSGKIFVSGIKLFHSSSGTLNYDFFRTFYKVCRKYAHNFPFIKSTCFYSKTDFYHVYKNLFKLKRKEFFNNMKRKPR